MAPSKTQGGVIPLKCRPATKVVSLGFLLKLKVLGMMGLQGGGESRELLAGL